MIDAAPNVPQGLRKRALIVGGVAAMACLIGALFDSAQFFRSYLVAYLFWLGIALGCLPLLMLHHLVGGTWGFVTRRILEAGTRTLAVVAVLFIPVLLGMQHIYEWTHPGVVAADPILQHKSVYLNTTFFIIRAVVFFAAWIVIAGVLNRWSAEQDRTGNPLLSRKLQLLSGPGILVYSLTMTFASFDWGMSIEPHWYSTMYGLLFVAGQVLSTLAFVIPIAVMLGHSESLREIFSPDVFHDLGNLMLAFTMLWAYLSFSQFLIIWAGNLPEEITWYLNRGRDGWQWIAALLALFHFAVPFLLMLARANKRKRHIITRIAIAILVMRFVDILWLIAPGFRPAASIHWLDVASWLAVGGLWLYVFFGQLLKQPVLPLRDPNFQLEKVA
jgi:hypothetical protein